VNRHDENNVAIKLSKATELEEPLLIRSAGYLRVPEGFKRAVGDISPKHYPNPVAYMFDDEESGTVNLIFSFSKKELDKLKNKGKTRRK
jgi:hypothetical protein